MFGGTYIILLFRSERWLFFFIYAVFDIPGRISRIFPISLAIGLKNIAFSFALLAIYFYLFPSALYFQGFSTSKLIPMCQLENWSKNKNF